MMRWQTFYRPSGKGKLDPAMRTIGMLTLLVLLLLIVAAVMLVGCGGTTETTATTAQSTTTLAQSTTTLAESTTTLAESTTTSSATGAGDVTTDAPMPAGVTKATDLKIAYFSFGSSNSYLQAGIQGVKDAAAKIGASIQVFDAEIDSLKQVNQMQTAISGGKFNAYVIEAVDGNAVTQIVKDSIANQKMLVSSINIPLENRELNEGSATRMPGTVTYVGGQTHDIYTTWVQKIIDLAKVSFPEGGDFAMFTGPKTGSNAKNQDDVANKLFPGTGFKMVTNSEQDYTTEKAYNTALNILQANPNLKFFVCSYTGMTQGIQQAVEQSGRQGTVKIYDMGGNQWALDAVKSGKIEMTMMLLPYTEAYDGVIALGDYADGKPVLQFINLTKDPSLPGTPFVTKDNVDKFKAEYK
jgi:ribose transport system substrate-binding protein